VRIKVPLRRIEEEEDVFQQETGEIVKAKVEKMVESEVDDKALALQARVDALQYSIYTMNQAAAKINRKEIFNYLKKNFGEYFD